jgi:sterol desaturase/sphingolipid hydroxylase (fatty acid hydroxylase superfamily)
MHWKRVYRLVHHPHHRSHHPTPWAAFAFHPLEALIQVAVYPIIIVIVPINAWAGTLWLLYVTLFNVFLHLGFELLPAGFVRHWFFRWHNTSVHHDMHHSHSNSNFGLYFNIWDHLMGTLHENYEATFEKVTRPGKKKPRKKSAALFKTRAA